MADRNMIYLWNYSNEKYQTVQTFKWKTVRWLNIILQWISFYFYFYNKIIRKRLHNINYCYKLFNLQLYAIQILPQTGLQSYRFCGIAYTNEKERVIYLSYINCFNNVDQCLEWYTLCIILVNTQVVYIDFMYVCM